jgi:hypothetical protein
MTVLQDLILSGRIVDLMLALIVIEIIAIMALRRARGGAIATGPLLINIGAGASIMLALRASLTDSGWPWIAAFLLASLLFHAADLVQRWQPPANR